LHGNYSLEKIKINNKYIPYQYIGNSLKACSKCASLIYGNKKIAIIGINDIADEMHRLFFTRGTQPYCYPGINFIPQWGCDINHRTFKDLKKLMLRLDYLNPKDKSKSFGLKTLEISDADE
jgi:hypothetical protein